jgi:uncharacterized membrane protein YphA (DoxX/SURF4 family)
MDINRLAMKGLHWSVGIVLIVESSRFAFGTGATKIIAHMGLPHWVKPVMGMSEIVAAVLFLIPPAMLVGAWGLEIIFALAAVVHILHGQYDVGWLVIYAMAVLVVATSGAKKKARRPA